MKTLEHRIAAAFSGRERAEEAIQALGRRGLADTARCRLIPPGQAPGDALGAATSRRVRRVLVRWHLAPALVGLAAGLAGVGALWRVRPEVFAAGPWLILAVGSFFGTIGGLLVGGAVALRPDEGWAFSRLQDRLARGEWGLVVAPRSRAEYREVHAWLSREADACFGSL